MTISREMSNLFIVVSIFLAKVMQISDMLYLPALLGLKRDTDCRINANSYKLQIPK